MDLVSVTELHRPASRADAHAALVAGARALAGGTALHGEAHLHPAGAAAPPGEATPPLTALVDLLDLLAHQVDRVNFDADGIADAEQRELERKRLEMELRFGPRPDVPDDDDGVPSSWTS